MRDYRGIARHLASRGRYGDDELVHMSHDELRALDGLGHLTRNPDTGLPEAFKLSSFFSNPISLLTTAAAIATAQPELLATDAALASGFDEFSGLAIPGTAAADAVGSAGTLAPLYDPAYPGTGNPSYSGIDPVSMSASGIPEYGSPGYNPNSVPEYGQPGYDPSASASDSTPTNSFGNALDSAEAWAKAHPLMTKGALSGGLSILQALGNKSLQKQNQKNQQALLARQTADRAANDNPTPWGGTGFTGAGVQPQYPTVPSYAQLGVSPLGAMYARPGALDSQLYQPQPLKMSAHGGLTMHEDPRHGMHAIEGGLHSMRDAMVHGDGGGQDDNVPAALSPSEYVMDADVVSALGDGNPDEGAKKLDAFRERVRRHKRSAPAHRIPPKAHPIEHYMREAA